ncbi:hypothetical protein SAMN02745166_02126 [Prosthecobacter debontii]|uniref:Uncharacterized protein n=1 Tax=Prosthecobacter debontii TaxID=48467 RepID=A0A1T4XYX6_9BACT|nr:hypothetical protein [Prosthecobacter debontii]SKA94255.1 hypothetical protein SAMN02745166_02126 [Prosthecobacter debontii]
MARYLAFSAVILALAGGMTAYLNAHRAQPSQAPLKMESNSGRSTAPGGVGGHQLKLSAVPGNI